MVNKRTMIPTLSRAAALLLPCLATMPAAATIIAGAPIGGHINSTVSHLASGADAWTLSYTNGAGAFISADYQASVETDGIHLYLSTLNSSFAQVGGAVADVYTVSGGTPGETLSFDAHFHVSGTMVTVPYPNPLGDYAGSSRYSVSAGLGLNGTNTTSGNPVIDLPFGRFSQQVFVIHGPASPTSLRLEFAEVTLDDEFVIPLTVTVGDPFPLAFGLQVDHGTAIESNLLNTATVSFALPSGYSIDSVAGFGSAAVPLPPAALLFAPALLVLGAVRRQGRRRHLV